MNGGVHGAGEHQHLVAAHQVEHIGRNGASLARVHPSGAAGVEQLCFVAHGNHRDFERVKLLVYIEKAALFAHVVQREDRAVVPCVYNLLQGRVRVVVRRFILVNGALQLTAEELVDRLSDAVFELAAYIGGKCGSTTAIRISLLRRARACRLGL